MRSLQPPNRIVVTKANATLTISTSPSTFNVGQNITVNVSLSPFVTGTNVTIAYTFDNKTFTPINTSTHDLRDNEFHLES